MVPDSLWNPLSSLSVILNSAPASSSNVNLGALISSEIRSVSVPWIENIADGTFSPSNIRSWGRSAVILRFWMKSAPNSSFILSICWIELEKLGDVSTPDCPRTVDGNFIRAFGPREALIGRIVLSFSLRIFNASLSGWANDCISISLIRLTPGCSGKVPLAVCNLGSNGISLRDERSNSICFVGAMIKTDSGKSPKLPRGVFSMPGISVLNPIPLMLTTKMAWPADWPLRRLIEAGCPWISNSKLGACGRKSLAGVIWTFSRSDRPGILKSGSSPRSTIAAVRKSFSTLAWLILNCSVTLSSACAS